MSQKEDENEFPYKNFYQSFNPPPPQPGQQTQQQMQPPSQFMPPTPAQQMPPYNYWDYYNYYAASAATASMPTPVGFDPNQVFSSSFSQPNKSSISQQQPALLTPSTASTSNKQNQQPSKPATQFQPQLGPTTPGSAYMPPPMPFMDYQMMLYQMAHQPYGYNPYQYGMPPMPGYGIPPYGTASVSGGQRQLQDDQLSLHSYHYDLDTRSEKKVNLNQSVRQQTLNNFKNEPKDRSINRSGLLMEDPNQSNEINSEQTTTSTTESVIKRDEHRMTPQLHQLPHVRASFSLNGIVQIRANDPCEGQPALVDMINLSDLMEQYLNNMKNMNVNDKTISLEDENEDDETTSANQIRNQILNNYKLMQEYPGPLIKEYTSKAQVIQFCQKNVKQCLSNSNINLIDPQSHALLWDFLALLVRQNGLIDLKTDISPLLLTGIGTEPLKQQSKHLGNSSSSASLVTLQQQQDFVLVNNDTEQQQSQQLPQVKQTEDEIHINKLRHLLGAGQKMDAIELAIKFNMWPHALFLASYSNLSTSNTAQPQLDTKILSKVKARFINSLAPNDPIQTCYQLLTGRIPTVANSLSKLDWNDWRRHLAMIVSNIDETNKDLVLNSIKTMGDSLASNGRVAASHFCYLLANCQFGTYDKKSSKLVLIGSSHNQDFSKFCQINAIQATEIFEFASSLSSYPNGMLEHFVKYKLIYTTRLLEFGLISEATKYIEVIAKAINLNPKLHSTKISTVFQLANRLKIFDSDFSLEDLNKVTSEPQWLQELTNNYKKLYLNKLWHLLPTEPEVQQIEQPQQTDLNVLTKVEPKTSEPSPIQQQYYQPQQYDVPDLSNDINRLKLQAVNSNTEFLVHSDRQESLPFNPQIPEQPQYNYNSNNQYQEQPAQLNNRRYEIDSQNLTYEPVIQQQQVPLFNPQELNSTHISNQSPTYDTKQTTFNFNPAVDSTNNQPRRPSTVNSNHGFQSNRSRQSSTSTSYEPAFNPYQQSIKQSNSVLNHQQQQQPFFDPSQMTRSATYPTNSNENAIKEEKLKNESVDHDDEDDFKKEKNKEKSQPKGNEWWFKRAIIDKIMPANTAKRMVLPDDKKKTIIWDEKSGRYLNQEAANDPASVIKPPPIFSPPQESSHSSSLNPMLVNQAQADLSGAASSMPPAAAGPNRFSLKNSATNKRSSYYSKIDVMADQTKKIPTPSDQQMVNPLLSTMPPPSLLPPRFFVPEAVSSQPIEEQLEQKEENQQEANAQYQNQYYVPQQNNAYQNQEQPNVDYYQQQQQQQQNNALLMPTASNYQANHLQVENNYTTEESSDSATNSAESYGSSQTSSSNDSAYIQQQQQYYQQYGYPQQQQQQTQNYSYDTNNQYYMPDQHNSERKMVTED